MLGCNLKDDLNAIASISVSSTILTPWSVLSDSKARDFILKREQDARYGLDNGLSDRTLKDAIFSL
jgi:hypothetical protein